MIIRIIAFGIMLLMASAIKSQSPSIPEGGLSQHIIDRLDILYGSDIFTSNQNFRRNEAWKLAESIYLSENTISNKIDWDLKYLLRDNNEWMIELNRSTQEIEFVDSTKTFYTIAEKKGLPYIKKEVRQPFLKHFYKTPANFYEIDKRRFKLRINPVINFNLGKADNNEDLIFQNTRGINIRAYIDDKIYVFTNILENQARFNDYHESRIVRFSTIPGNGLYKTYNSNVIDKINGWDFLNAQAYVGMHVSESVSIELGHGRHFIGNGMRSLLLSNYSHNYFYLKFNTQVWKFHYQNLFAELAPISGRLNPGDNLLPKKYMANHYLAFKPNKNFEIGLFETVVFSRENQFELQYLNPVILYRTVEQFLDSPDNVLIGLNGKWNIKKRIQLYGQLILDEFKLNEFTSGNGWWGNKYGVQLGLKYLNLGNIDHLDAQVEYNTVTPYTYSHRDTLTLNADYSVANYSHHNQPLAHPIGANFREIVGSLKYRLSERINLHGRIMVSSYGDDNSSENWGNNILTPNNSRIMDFGNELLQGEKTDVTLIGLDASYFLWHNYYFDFNFLYRKSESTLESNNFNTTYIGGGLRINLGKRNIDY